ncbi:hypothetical protein [Clostridium paraputrificum]|jgi:predicted RNA-binding Zn-ribbon protein involved in translation (DUF1610 family)|uniref:hypothetical protein n=1 Tax=Clostridium paraputrificum TaxID=29363 RepID=UPI00189F2818|nr:hypothetical protein [Clostridium paraputrificum]MDB2091380.1 hypothetical protein [Clostridium paraputrificum]
MGFGNWLKEGLLEAAENKKNGVSIYKRQSEVTNKESNNKHIEDNKICCPKCGSTQLTANKKGFSLGKALVGGIALVPIAGVATGMLGKNKIIITCLSCGKQFKPGKR